jgi:hypothetical protein
MNHYANYKLDNQEIMHIANRVYDYERLNDTTIDNVYITFHEPVNYYRSYTTEYTNLTSRILTCSWMVHPLINHYLQRDYSENYIDYSEFESLFNNVNDASNNMIKFSDQNYDETLNYKMIFAKRALYICIF